MLASEIAEILLANIKNLGDFQVCYRGYIFKVSDEDSLAIVTDKIHLKHNKHAEDDKDKFYYLME